jgi:hypothetical protein
VVIKNIFEKKSLMTLTGENIGTVIEKKLLMTIFKSSYKGLKGGPDLLFSRWKIIKTEKLSDHLDELYPLFTL